ncbi:hypothetical protein KC19_3G135000 [Ceratodon purpureus]|uniref:Uncharacterized protein n=1 Tax=Ceratodon purpureus TaxID=3225 RepID=A0A8T0IKK1_CERPU|nr:hypothetical protein KC19_3G135000 [Ceratodon purpureus]
MNSEITKIPSSPQKEDMPCPNFLPARESEPWHSPPIHVHAFENLKNLPKPAQSRTTPEEHSSCNPPTHSPNSDSLLQSTTSSIQGQAACTHRSVTCYSACIQIHHTSNNPHDCTQTQSPFGILTVVIHQQPEQQPSWIRGTMIPNMLKIRCELVKHRHCRTEHTHTPAMSGVALKSQKDRTKRTKRPKRANGTKGTTKGAKAQSPNPIRKTTASTTYPT